MQRYLGRVFPMLYIVRMPGRGTVGRVRAASGGPIGRCRQPLREVAVREMPGDHNRVNYGFAGLEASRNQDGPTVATFHVLIPGACVRLEPSLTHLTPQGGHSLITPGRT